MFAVIIDNKGYDNWSERDSLLKLSVFSETLFSVFKRSISRIIPEKIIVFSQSDLKNILSDDVELINDEAELINFFLDKPDAFSVVFDSAFFIDVVEDFVIKFIKNNEECNVLSEKNEVICRVLKNKNAAKILFEKSRTVDRRTENRATALLYEGYVKKVDKPLGYKEFLCDILCNRTTMKLPEIAQGVYAEETIPDGNFTIIPPVYFDIGVQVEEGAVIGPCSVLMRETLVSKNSNVRKTVLLNGVYVSSDVYVDNSLLCENVSVRRKSVVMSGSVLSNNSTVGEETIIENNSLIMPYTKVDEFKNQYVNFRKETNDSPAGFYGYSPEKAALLGAAVGKVFNRPCVAVASDGGLNSTALKFGLLGGLITTGATCYDFGNTFLSSLHYFVKFCELDCAVFVSGNRFGTVITVFTKESYSLTSSQYYNIKALMISKNIERCGFDECKNIRQIHGMTRMYIQNLIKNFNSPFKFSPIFKCDNKRIQSVVEIASSKIGYTSGKKRIVFNINTEGTKVRVEYENVVFSHRKIREIVGFYSNEKNFTHLWEFDAVILCFELMNVLQKNSFDLKEASKSLPRFYIAEGSAEYKDSVSTLMNKIGNKDNIELISGEIHFGNDNDEVIINKSKDNLRIVAKSLSTETAEELVGDILKIIL